MSLTIFRNATLFDGVEREARPNMTIVVEGDRIREVREGQTAAAGGPLDRLRRPDAHARLDRCPRSYRRNRRRSRQARQNAEVLALRAEPAGTGRHAGARLHHHSRCGWGRFRFRHGSRTRLHRWPTHVRGRRRHHSNRRPCRHAPSCQLRLRLLQLERGQHSRAHRGWRARGTPRGRATNCAWARTTSRSWPPVGRHRQPIRSRTRNIHWKNCARSSRRPRRGIPM